MNYNIIKKEIKDKVFKNLYLLYGDEPFLIQVIIDSIKKNILSTPINGMNYFSSNSKIDIDWLFNCITTIPMIGKTKMIVCKDSGLFVGNNNNEVQKLLNNMNEDTYLIFHESKIDKKNSYFKQLSEESAAYVINSRSSQEIKSYIMSKFKKANKKISANNLFLFMEYSGRKLLDIDKDIEKILLYMDDKIEVKKDMILKLCQGSLEVKIYELTNSLFEKNNERAIKKLRELLADKMPVQVILVALHNSYMELLKVRDALDHKKEISIKRNNRPIHEYALKKLVQHARNYSILQIKAMILHIADSDVAIKFGEIKDVVALELLVISLTTKH